jgi:hypothetical protein
VVAGKTDKNLLVGNENIPLGGKAEASMKDGGTTGPIPASNKLNNNELLVNRFASMLKKLLQENPKGNFVIPIKNSIFLLDMLDMLLMKINNFQKIHFISSSAEATINYSNINVDYLNKMLQSKIFMNSPELPLSNIFLMKNRHQQAGRARPYRVFH